MLRVHEQDEYIRLLSNKLLHMVSSNIEYSRSDYQRQYGHGGASEISRLW